MPSTSERQRKKMGVLYRQGKITKTQLEHFQTIKPKGAKKVRKTSKGKA